MILIDKAGIVELATLEISPERVGWKAAGLSKLPLAWTPQFFVVSAFCVNEWESVRNIDDWIQDGLVDLDLNSDHHVIIRSSGVSETIMERGQLPSKVCAVSDIKSTITSLSKSVDVDTQVHWIIQKYYSPKLAGHMSNERRVSKEDRDWVVEFDALTDLPRSPIRFGVRTWRDGTTPNTHRLDCTSRIAITLRLKDVAIFARGLKGRMHFEWVWDGAAVWIVQADGAEALPGTDPYSLLPQHLSKVNIPSLRVFRTAVTADYESYRKLGNAKTYGDLGYNMPSFFVMDNAEEIRSILSGTVSDQLKIDLSELTKRPFIIRTDGKNIPSDKRHMLPRSDELRSPDSAVTWLLGKFKDGIEVNSLGDCGLSLLAHHFIPSAASAWARAEPGKGSVRIEALWGIPEGLYWYTHDTFEVDTSLYNVNMFGDARSPFRKRVRYKETFIASSTEGVWLPFQTAATHDWRRSISKEKWIREIALTTRRLAEREGYAVDVMWLIDNHAEATRHKVLPWYHIESELTGATGVAPRQKSKLTNDYVIRTKSDWDKLRLESPAGGYPERVTVRPEDPEIIRDQAFAKELGTLAAQRGFVVQLYGGVLSHAYYMLRKQGARVECIDLFGADEDVDEYYKLVRNKVPEQIHRNGERANVIRLTGDALIAALRYKLVEEAFEAFDAGSGSGLIEELADLQQVVEDLCNLLGENLTAVEAQRQEKRVAKGGFGNGLMLVETATPHSLPIASPDVAIATLDLAKADEVVVTNPDDIPIRAFPRRPDLRKVEGQVEKVINFGSGVASINEIKEVFAFNLPVGNDSEQDFSLVVELKRESASIRCTVRLRSDPYQIPIVFPH